MNINKKIYEEHLIKENIESIELISDNVDSLINLLTAYKANISEVTDFYYTTYYDDPVDAIILELFTVRNETIAEKAERESKETERDKATKERHVKYERELLATLKAKYEK